MACRYPASGRHACGFTLIEILVVLVVVGLLMAALWGGLRVGVQGWRRVADASRTLEARTTAERALRMVIRNLAGDDPGCQGDAHRLICAGTLPDPETGRPRAVLMALGVEDEARLVLRWQPRPPGLRAPEAPDEAVQRSVLLAPAHAVSLHYFKPGTGWVDRWAPGGGPPMLVRIAVEGANGAWPDIVAHPIAAMPGGP